MTAVRRLALVGGAAAGILLAGPAGATTCAPGFRPHPVCIRVVCTWICVPDTDLAALPH